MKRSIGICFVILVVACSTVKENQRNMGLNLEKAGTEKVYFTHNGKPLLSFGGLSDFIFYAAEDAYDYKLWAGWAAEHGINHVRAYSQGHILTFSSSVKNMELIKQEIGA